LVILIFALMVLVLGTITSGFYRSRVSLLLLICGMVVFLAGWKHLAAISFPLGFLIFMIPSSTLVAQITFPLQILASMTATFLLTGIGVPAIREGNIILLPNARLEVAEACSGIRSLFSLITLTVIYGYLASGVTQKRPMRVTSKPANGNGARGRWFRRKAVAFVGMSNVLSEAKKQQVIALGRLGWPLRRIEQETGVRRETAGAYLKAAGIGVRPPGAWGRRPPAKPANENGVTTGSDAAKPAITVNPNPNPENLSTKGKATARPATAPGKVIWLKPLDRPPFNRAIVCSIAKPTSCSMIWPKPPSMELARSIWTC
jgi:hypothetical protein